MDIDKLSFRKMAIGFFSCFPNIEKISISTYRDQYILQFWKHGIQIQCDYDGWKNVNYMNFYSNNPTSKTGRVSQIPLKFLGYKNLSAGTTQFKYCLDRRNLRLKSKQKNINSSEKLNKILNSISYANAIKSMTCVGNGNIELTNLNGDHRTINFRGCGVKFDQHYRYQVTKNC